MSDYLCITRFEDRISLGLLAGDSRVMAVGEKMEAVCPEAYMNGYNWEAVLGYYLGKTAPDLLKGMDTDPEAGMYVAYYPLTPENEAKAERLAGIIHDLVEHGETLCQFVQTEGDNIPWD